MQEIIVAILAFLAIQFLLVTLIVFAKHKLRPGGDITIRINEKKELCVPSGNKLLPTLTNQGIFISSACGI
ncbi:MAG: NADH:ubiquinone reductase (Na(+)-transporting) subunit F, partial [Candidatus Electrothrix sp. AR3]|nr:NADH:ubiquinone reductase (Na(+)-transporting) subunit F [Candidatus Electrothrix sp. AR3]